MSTPPAPAGTEWIVDAHDCDPEALRSRPRLEGLLARIVAELDLVTVATPVWHVFPNPGGITGLVVLAESHLTCHTFPEYALATFNLYRCRPGASWPWAQRLEETLGAARVSVRSVARGGP